MIIDYLDVDQSLNYLEKNTGDKYTFDNLKELNFAGKLDVFFYKSCLIYNTYRSDRYPPPIEVSGMRGSPFPYHLAFDIKQVRGIFALKDLLLFNDSEPSQLKSKVVVESLYEQQYIIFDEIGDNEYEYVSGDECYLAHAELFDLQFLSDGSVDSASLRNKAIARIEHNELRFKKTQLDNLINKVPEKPPVTELAALKDRTVFKDLGKYQKQLITYDAFTSNQIVCLILDHHPDSSILDNEFLSYWQMVSNAISSDELIPSDRYEYEIQKIDAQQVKVWLARNNYIYEGFNDNLPIDPVEHIKQLTQQLAAANAEILELQDQLKEKTLLIDNDLKQVHHKSFKTVDRIMYAMAKLTKYDNSHPTSQNMPSLNAQITTLLQNDGLPLEYEAVGKWLTRVKNVQTIK
tara:strand:- start:579 stop:1793 length:1215 start_codon:yes stop_codon:yes gene_type:complete